MLFRSRREEYLDLAETTLKVFGASYQQYGIEAASYAQTALFQLRTPIEIVLVGTKEEVQELHRESLKIYEPRKIIKLVDIRDTREREGLKVIPEPGTAYVCSGEACSRPVSRAEDLLGSISLFQKGA